MCELWGIHEVPRIAEGEYLKMLYSLHEVQGAGCELRHLAIFQSGGFSTEIKTFCVLFFINEDAVTIQPALRRSLNLSGLLQFLTNREDQSVQTTCIVYSDNLSGPKGISTEKARIMLIYRTIYQGPFVWGGIANVAK